MPLHLDGSPSMLAMHPCLLRCVGCVNLSGSHSCHRQCANTFFNVNVRAQLSSLMSSIGLRVHSCPLLCVHSCHRQCPPSDCACTVVHFCACTVVIVDVLHRIARAQLSTFVRAQLSSSMSSIGFEIFVAAWLSLVKE